MLRALLTKSVLVVPWRLRGAIKRLPLVAYVQRRLLARFLEGSEFVHTVDAGPARGLKYLIKLPEDKGIWTGTYELELATKIAAAVQCGETCLDIGGWRGFFGGVMALAGASRVFVFEPLPANAGQIRRMIALNPKLPIELIQAAVGEQGGVLEFCVMPESSMGKLVVSSFQKDRGIGEVISVPVVTLDALLDTGRIPDAGLIKIDVEGAEAFVLRGARRLLMAKRPKLFIEVHSLALAQECGALLNELGYEISVLESRARRGEEANLEICHFVAIGKS